MPSANDILGVIMGGGQGKRLHPLTQLRAKPAVPMAGKYRLIDIPISNCINAGIHRIAVLTMFKSVSLHRHISQTYLFDRFHGGWVQILAAEQTPQSADWYQGTADAVRKQLLEIQATEAKYVLVLAGDHLYRMDYEKMAAFHWEKGADITVAVQPVPREEASRFGILKSDSQGTITDFAEKPDDPQILETFVSRDDPEHPYLGSMGIYLFNTDVLIEMLEGTTYDDFGGEVIPAAIQSYAVYGYDFDGYWADIGTIRSYYETSLSLTTVDPPFNFYDPEDPIYTRPRFLPGSILDGATMSDVMLAEGCRIYRAKIDHAIIGLRSQVRDGARIKDTILMGADYYDTLATVAQAGGIPLGIGPDCHIEGAIIDKNVRVGEGVVIRPFPRGTNEDHDSWVVRDGIVVVPKDKVLPAGTHIGPE